MASYRRVRDSEGSNDFSLEPLETTGHPPDAEASAFSTSISREPFSKATSEATQTLASTSEASTSSQTEVASNPFEDALTAHDSARRQPFSSTDASSSRHVAHDSLSPGDNDPEEPFLRPRSSSSVSRSGSSNPSFPIYDDSGHPRLDLPSESPYTLQFENTINHASQSPELGPEPEPESHRPTSRLSKFSSASSRFSLLDLTDEFVANFRQRKLWEPAFLQLWVSVPLSLAFIGIAIASEVLWIHSRNNGGSKFCDEVERWMVF